MFLRLVSYLPLSVLYAAGCLLHLTAWHLLRYRRNTALDNLQRAFPEYSPAQIAALGRRVYRGLGETAVETIKLATISRSALQRRVHFVNPEVLTEIRREQPMLLLAAHQANWEWLLQCSVLRARHPMFAVYKPLHAKAANRFICKVRARFGGTPMPYRNFGIEAMHRRRQRCFFAVVADQAPRASNPVHHAPLFGRDTVFHAGPARLAAMLECPVFFTAIKRLRRGFYEVRFEPLGTVARGQEEKLTRRYVDAVEHNIRVQPETYLWTHRRWKRTPASRHGTGAAEK